MHRYLLRERWRAGHGRLGLCIYVTLRVDIHGYHGSLSLVQHAAVARGGVLDAAVGLAVPRLLISQLGIHPTFKSRLHHLFPELSQFLLRLCLALLPALSGSLLASVPRTSGVGQVGYRLVLEGLDDVVSVVVGVVLNLKLLLVLRR